MARLRLRSNSLVAAIVGWALCAAGLASQSAPVPAYPNAPAGFDVRRPNIPGGRVERVEYDSKVTGNKRPAMVYTPPGFNAHGKIKYPVLYLIHGGSDTEETWTKVGRANLIADNLMAQKKAKPMIIVMPYANVRPNPMADFTNDMINDSIPYIENNYPVLSNSKSRAIAGFSVGGGQTPNIGLIHSDKFA